MIERSDDFDGRVELEVVESRLDGLVVASKLIENDQIPDKLGFLHVDVPDTTLTPGTDYYLVLQIDPDKPPTSGSVAWAGRNGDPYTFGKAFEVDSETGPSELALDFAFRTYMAWDARVEPDIVGNVIEQNDGDGIASYASSPEAYLAPKVKGNEVTLNDGHGIGSYASSMEANLAPLIGGTSEDEKNVIDGNGGYGIYSAGGEPQNAGPLGANLLVLNDIGKRMWNMEGKVMQEWWLEVQTLYDTGEPINGIHVWAIDYLGDIDLDGYTGEHGNGIYREYAHCYRITQQGESQNLSLHEVHAQDVPEPQEIQLTENKVVIFLYPPP